MNLQRKEESVRCVTMCLNNIVDIVWSHTNAIDSEFLIKIFNDTQYIVPVVLQLLYLLLFD